QGPEADSSQSIDRLIPRASGVPSIAPSTRHQARVASLTSLSKLSHCFCSSKEFLLFCHHFCHATALSSCCPVNFFNDSRAFGGSYRSLIVIALIKASTTRASLKQ